MNIGKLALRNLGRQRRRTLLLGGALAAGVLVMTVLNAIASALAANAQANLVESLGGGVFVSAQEASPSGRVVPVLRRPDEVVQAFEAAGHPVKVAEPRSSARVGLLFGSAAQTANLEGLSSAAWSRLPLRLGLVEGSWEESARSLVLPRELAQGLGVEAGDEVLVRGQTITGQETVGDFVVIAVVDDPAAFGVPSAYARLEAVNELLNLPAGSCQTLTLTLAGPPLSSDQWYTVLGSHLRLVRPNLDPLGGLGGLARSAPTPKAGEPPLFTLRTLEEVLAPVLGLVDTLRAVNTGLLTLLVAVLVVGVSNTFRMVLLERTREIGTLRALGMHRTEVGALFLAEAVVLAVGAVAVGTLAGALVGSWVSLVPWSGLPGMAGIFLRGQRLGWSLSWRDEVVVGALVVAAAALAAWGPARAASRLSPAEALRTQN